MNIQVDALIKTALEIGFYILLLIFSVQALFLAYHWFTYGSSTRISTLALAIYLTGGAVLLLTFSFALTIL